MPLPKKTKPSQADLSKEQETPLSQLLKEWRDSEEKGLIPSSKMKQKYLSQEK